MTPAPALVLTTSLRGDLSPILGTQTLLAPDPPPPPQVSAGVGKPPHGLGVCIWMHLVNGTGNSPVSGTAHPRSSQTGQVIRGLR